MGGLVVVVAVLAGGVVVVWVVAVVEVVAAVVVVDVVETERVRSEIQPTLSGELGVVGSFSILIELSR